MHALRIEPARLAANIRHKNGLAFGKRNTDDSPGASEVDRDELGRTRLHQQDPAGTRVKHRCDRVED
jgi:hypothetical protein